MNPTPSAKFADDNRRSLRAATRVLVALMALVVCLLATPGSANAYADPGAGAFVYQALYGALLGGTFYFRRFLDRVFVRRK
jgi:hypothetical protein